MSNFAKTLAIVGYLICMAAVILGMQRFREQAISTYGTSTAKSEWQTWRDAAKQQSEDAGPIRRRPPESELPPAFVLMEDHFVACLLLALLLSSVLYGTLTLLIYGALPKSPRPS